jgi:DedD protein
VQRPLTTPAEAAKISVETGTVAVFAGRNEASASPPVESGSAGKPSNQQSGAAGEGAGTTRSAGAPERTPARGPHLQAGVFMQAANAQALKSTLEAQGLPVYIESRVHIGPFRDRKEAERMREKLKEMGVSTVLVGQ